MDRFKTTLLTAACLVVAAATQAHAGQVTYSSYSVLNNRNVTLNDAKLGIMNEGAGSGQITLSGTNTPGGIIAAFCIDIVDTLKNSGTFDAGSFVGGAFGRKVNALITHAAPDLSTNSDSSSALQVAIWRAEYGSGLTVSAPTSVSNLADTYLSNVSKGIWTADPTKRVAVLAAHGSNQDQAYLTAVPEPASMAIIATGLIGLGLVRRKRA